MASNVGIPEDRKESLKTAFQNEFGYGPFDKKEIQRVLSEKVHFNRNMIIREICKKPLFFHALNWYKSTETLLYNYGMRLEIYHLAERK